MLVERSTDQMLQRRPSARTVRKQQLTFRVKCEPMCWVLAIWVIQKSAERSQRQLATCQAWFRCACDPPWAIIFFNRHNLS